MMDNLAIALTELLDLTIRDGSPKYNSGDIQGCYETYVKGAQEAQNIAFSEDLQAAIDQASNSKDPKEAAWVLRRCFDALLEDNNMKPGTHVEPLEDLLRRTIRQGVQVYNQGDTKGCFELYIESARYACEQTEVAQSPVGQLLEQAGDEAKSLGEAGDFDQAAWILRRCFDGILKQHASTRGSAAGSSKIIGEASIHDSGISSDSGYWQDEKTPNNTDYEIGTSLRDISFILRASIKPKTHKRFTGKNYKDSFPASEVVEVLTGLGLAKSREAAVLKCSILLAGSFLISVSHESETDFQDGTRLYRFPDREELQASFERLHQNMPQNKYYPEGSLNAQLVIALQKTLDLPGNDVVPKSPVVSAKRFDPNQLSTFSPGQQKGYSLAQSALKVEQLVDIRDRKYLLKSYEKCFVGKDAVAKLVEEMVCTSEDEAVALMQELSEVGLIHHVLYEHGFEAKHLFYRFISATEIRKVLDSIAILPSEPAGKGVIRQTALTARYQQFGDLDVASILNSFFCTDSEEGWDLVDLQNWRDNMKRWGFGRREDQDDTMVDELSHLALNVDPETWYDSLSDEDREQWESPWGVLAQVAIFDQVPRSAFRGTPEAFKWDPLAIKAIRTAIERGYFETAYKSTLNQFLVLLPLEHSEDWEDQKLGVTLMMRLLSTVAVQDEGLSDYEIVKRMEFSKRLSTAFLEHAQVIAKFKRYPHRNKLLNRTTTLEERVWLASDLVPRWAKSQNPDDARKNVIQLPVIPLKRITRK